jgi:predicted secreted protein
MAEFTGGDIDFSIGGTAVTQLTNATLSISANMLETSNKDSAFQSFIPGKKESSIGLEGMYDESDSDSLFQLIDAWLNDTEISWTYARNDTPASGEFSQSAGDGYTSQLDITANDDETMNISSTIEVNGAITTTKAA